MKSLTIKLRPLSSVSEVRNDAEKMRYAIMANDRVGELGSPFGITNGLLPVL